MFLIGTTTPWVINKHQQLRLKYDDTITIAKYFMFKEAFRFLQRWGRYTLNFVRRWVYVIGADVSYFVAYSFSYKDVSHRKLAGRKSWYDLAAKRVTGRLACTCNKDNMQDYLTEQYLNKFALKCWFTFKTLRPNDVH